MATLLIVHDDTLSRDTLHELLQKIMNAQSVIPLFAEVL